MMGLDQNEMAQALNLTKAGKLAEATEAIQRMLQSASAPQAMPNPNLGSYPMLESASPLPTLASPPTMVGSNPLSRVPTALRRSLGSPHNLQTPLQNLAALPGQAPPSGSLGTGVLLDRMYAIGSSTRRYKIYVPPDCPNQGVPVIVMLHGGTQAVLDFAAGTGMNPLADLHHFLVVYPEQDARANPMRYWNWFRPQDQHTGDGEPALIAGITEQVISDYNADPDRVFMVGFSAGAAMAVVMAATYPHLYAGAGVHSGLPYGAAHDVPSAFALMRGADLTSGRRDALRIPLIVFHGDHDEIVSVVNASHIRQQRLGVDGVIAAAAGVDVRQGEVPGGHTYTRTTYSSQAEVLLEQWIVHGAGHAWFGGTAGCSYTDPLGPDASTEMVRFFSEHGRRLF
jgi:poly(hydroxyalkanoate) depolymerase family esterase